MTTNENTATDVLVLESRTQLDQTVHVGSVMLTPSLGADYWLYRVRLSDKQAIIGFPKFLTIGIGFAVEGDDWNTNLPYTCDGAAIYEHIKCNKGDDSISDEACLAAIRLIQGAARANHEPPLHKTVAIPRPVNQHGDTWETTGGYSVGVGVGGEVHVGPSKLQGAAPLTVWPGEAREIAAAMLAAADVADRLAGER